MENTWRCQFKQSKRQDSKTTLPLVLLSIISIRG